MEVISTWQGLMGALNFTAGYGSVANSDLFDMWVSKIDRLKDKFENGLNSLEGSGVGTDIYLVKDPTYPETSGLEFGKNVLNSVISSGTAKSALISFANGAMNTGTLTGGLGNAAAVLATKKTSEGNIDTSVVANTIASSLSLKNIIGGGAAATGLAVLTNSLYNKYKDGFVKKVTQNLVDDNIITEESRGKIDPDDVQVSTLLQEHEDASGNKVVTPYVSSNIIEKIMEYLYEIGAYSATTVKKKLVLPSTGVQTFEVTAPTVQDFDNLFSKFGVYSDLDEYPFFELLKNNHASIAQMVFDKFDAVYNFDDGGIYLIALYMNGMRDVTSSGSDWNSLFFTVDVIRRDGGKYDVAKSEYVNTTSVEYDQLGLLTATNTTQTGKRLYVEQYGGLSTFDDVVNLIESKNITSGWGGYSPAYDEFYIGNGLRSYVAPYDSSGIDETSIVANTSNIVVEWKEEGGSDVEGVEATDYTLDIGSLEDVAKYLAEWKEKNAIEVETAITDFLTKTVSIVKTAFLPITIPYDDSAWLYPTETFPDVVIPDTAVDVQAKVIKGIDDVIESIKTKVDYIEATEPIENNSTVVPPTEILGVNGSGLWSVYNPNLAQINAFGAWLWSSNIFDQIKQYFSDPMQGIIGLHKIYCKPTTGGVQSIIAGYLDSGVNAVTVTNQYNRIDCGTVKCAEYFGSALDYTPYTDVSLYLPFIGIVTLNTDIVMGSRIHIYYDVDILTGACLATIEVMDTTNTNISIYQFNGVCSVQVPLTSGNYGSVIASLVTTGAAIGATVASGGALAPVALGGAVNALNAGTNVKQEGTIGSNVGAMAYKKPYLIITRKIPAMANNYNSLSGYPSNKRVRVGSLSGYSRLSDVFISSATATNEEKERIEELLKNGVIL